MTDTRRTAAPLAAGVAVQSLRPPSTPSRSAALVPVRRFGLRLSREWLPQVGWAVGRTGRPGLVGLGLVAASAIFFATTHLQITAEVHALETELAAAKSRAAAPRSTAPSPLRALDALPARAEMPAVLGTLLAQAGAAKLALDTGKYEMSATKTGRITRYKLSFPVTGPYPQVRQFIDATLKEMPAVAISELSLERKAIGDPVVEAQIRMTVFARSAP